MILMKPPILIPLSLSLTLALGACGAASSNEADTHPARSSADADSSATQVASPEPRLAVTYDGGVLVLDAATGDTVADIKQPGFVRVSRAGDDRHVLIAGEGGFHVLDLGTWSTHHGDHGHSYAGTPHLTGVTFPATEPGHVVNHAGRTVLFDDGTGRITSFDPYELENGKPETLELTTPEPHHGVALELANGRLLHTVGDEDHRSGVALVDADGHRLAGNDECPGVHGEAMARHTAVFGCEDGVLLVRGRKFTKVASPDDYGRIGNQAGSEHSPVLLGDYKIDAEAALERPTRVSLIDTRTAEMRLVDLGASYTFRSLGRGPDGEGLVLGTDGALRVLDVNRGRVTRTIDVVAPWREPLIWQQPRPALFVMNGLAYVTEPASSELHVVDLETASVIATHQLPQVPNELVGTPG
jgi:hypothetical protein